MATIQVSNSSSFRRTLSSAKTNSTTRTEEAKKDLLSYSDSNANSTSNSVHNSANSNVHNKTKRKQSIDSKALST